ncbi:CRISPR system precrRNA processing endoribonuclease RAMP protein Cas6 [Pelistega suis]|uniref:CRISPR system precrRNA processing endoribonuclease RAMP protein Cas6 n=1 Tax=Pelistega suis TaxID=1631957 RepID=UPI00211B74B4|nr:CRISPR system precrRNA processing endoribonuclease RAMP protein Cas6 [Pelistega suis]
MQLLHNTVIRRLSAISTVHWHKVLSLDIDALWADIAAVNVTYQQLSWCNWTRYSNRQQQKIVLKGIVGEIVLENLSALLAQALYSGQWLHVGKETVFGYGKYRLLTS